MRFRWPPWTTSKRPSTEQSEVEDVTEHEYNGYNVRASKVWSHLYIVFASMYLGDLEVPQDYIICGINLMDLYHSFVYILAPTAFTELPWHLKSSWKALESPQTPTFTVAHLRIERRERQKRHVF
jgi:hypothetical protein